MEWTRESLRDTYILVKSSAHAKKIIEFYESFGFQNKITKAPEVGWYICAVGSLHQNNVLLTDVVCYTRTRGLKELVTNPWAKPRRKFPREMMVSDDKKNWEKKLVAGKIKSTSPYVAYIKQEFKEGQVFKFLLAFKYAKEID